MTIEDQLRQTLHDRACHAPDGTGLLPAVNERSRRLGRRRNLGLLTVALLAAIAITAGYLLPAPRPPVPTAALVRADYRLTGFPLAPGWLPPDFDIAPTLSHDERDFFLRYTVASGRLTVDVLRRAPGIHWPGTDSTVTVNGHPATLRVGQADVQAQRTVGVTWEQDGKWIVVWHQGHLTAAEVLRFAENLGPGGIAPRLGFTVGLLPPGFVFAGYSNIPEYAMTILWFRNGTWPEEIVHFTVRPSQDSEPAGDTHPRVISLPLDAGRVVWVQTNLTEARLSDADFRELARAVDPG